MSDPQLVKEELLRLYPDETRPLYVSLVTHGFQLYPVSSPQRWVDHPTYTSIALADIPCSDVPYNPGVVRCVNNREEINWWAWGEIYQCKNCGEGVATFHRDNRCQCGNLHVLNGQLQQQ